MNRFIALALAPLLLVGLAAAMSTKTPRDKAESGTTISVAAEDAEMNAAFGKARHNFPAFLRALDAGQGDPQSFAVKLRIVDGDSVEYFWAFEVKRSGEKFTGTLNNEPEQVHNVQNGQSMTFAASEVYDWMYRAGDKFIGNYTTCILIAHEPPDEAETFKQQYGIECE
jgi:uncharacterized protein YegJ (DUF2314 family)